MRNCGDHRRRGVWGLHVGAGGGPLEPAILPHEPVKVVEALTFPRTPEGLNVDTRSAAAKNTFVVEVFEAAGAGKTLRRANNSFKKGKLDRRILRVRCQPGVMPEENGAMGMEGYELERTGWSD